MKLFLSWIPRRKSQIHSVFRESTSLLTCTPTLPLCGMCKKCDCAGNPNGARERLRMWHPTLVSKRRAPFGCGEAQGCGMP